MSYGAPPPPASQPYGYGYGHGGVPPKTETKAIVALVLAVAAYTPTVPFVGAIAALFVARAARRDIEASGGALTGLSLCTWAVVLSWVHLGFLALLIPVLLVLFVLPFSAL